MDVNENVGAVKMKPLYALKKACEEYPLGRLIGGGILKRFQTIVNKKQLEKQEEKTNKNIKIGDNSMFGHEILQELGIEQKSNGEYVKRTDEELIR